MRIDSVCRAALVAACLAGPASAQEPAPPKHPPAVEKAEDAAGANPILIPEVKLEGIPFSDAINFLRDVDPTFQAVVSIAPGADAGGPIIQDLKLKNVSAQAVLQVLSAAYPQITVAQDETARIWIIKIDQDPRVIQRGAEVKPYTGVFRLREIVDQFVAKTEEKDPVKARSAALTSILSLLQAAGETQGEAKSEVSLKLHEPTETLVFKGSEAQAELVTQALQTLRPSDEDVNRAAERRVVEMEEKARGMERNSQERIKRAEQRFAEAENERLRVAQEVIKLSAEVERLRIRLEEAQKNAGKPTDTPANAAPDSSKSK